VPSRLLAAELDRICADFTFLRRSFLADTAGRPLAPAVGAIRRQLSDLAQRSRAQIVRDRDELILGVSRSAAQPA
jgi:hypothetical protein